MDLEKIIEECGRTTQEKGFEVDLHVEQMLLIATEIGEAIEELDVDRFDKLPPELRYLVQDFLMFVRGMEAYRDAPRLDGEGPGVRDEDALVEELDDVCIRVFSYVWGNGLTEKFLHGLRDKMDRNKDRPHKHGRQL